MLPVRGWIACSLFVAASVVVAPNLVAQTTPQTPAKHHHKRKVAKPFVLPPLPRGPLSQVPMDQIPPSPAKVTFQGGLLSISAQNSPLGEILRDVQKLTGASIDIPPGPSANERVVTQIGPGAPRDVLARLLNGSSFNYVMVGSNEDPSAVSSVVLTSKPSTPGETQTAANVYQPTPEPPNRFPQPMPFNQQVMAQPQQPQPGAAQGDEDSKDDEENADDSADDQSQPQAGGDAAVAPPQGDPNQPNTGPRTPEQILEMLRNRQQQPPAVNPPGEQPPQQ